MFRQLGPCFQHHLGIDLCGLATEGKSFFHRQQNLTDPEQADDRDQKIEAAHQIGESEDEPQLSGYRVHADGSKRKPEHHRGKGLECRTLAHADETAERKQIDRKKLRWAELQCEFRDQRREEGDHHHGDECADKR